MFSAGIAQQMIRRQERLQRALAQLEKGEEESMGEIFLLHLTLHPAVREVSTTLEELQSSLDQCVPLLQRLNQVLPEANRLEPLKLHSVVQPDTLSGGFEEEEEEEDGQQVGGREEEGEEGREEGRDNWHNSPPPDLTDQ